MQKKTEFMLVAYEVHSISLFGQILYHKAKQFRPLNFYQGHSKTEIGECSKFK